MNKPVNVTVTFTVNQLMALVEYLFGQYRADEWSLARDRDPEAVIEDYTVRHVESVVERRAEIAALIGSLTGEPPVDDFAERAAELRQRYEVQQAANEAAEALLSTEVES